MPVELVSVHPEDVPEQIVGPGVSVRRLWRAGPGEDASRALIVDFEAGAQWPGVDVHEPGPEEVYIVEGTFLGLTGEGSIHGVHTFLHFERGTSHSPSSPTGGRLFVFYPEG
jgi:quercetin dioxygenase-like cupin family protein